MDKPDVRSDAFYADMCGIANTHGVRTFIVAYCMDGEDATYMKGSGDTSVVPLLLQHLLDEQKTIRESRYGSSVG